MKKRVNAAYLLALSLVTLVITATFHKICSHLCATRYISYSFDPKLSMQMRSAIEKQVELLECDGTYQVSALISELLRIFPDIKQIDIRSLPYNVAEISITAPDPVICINNNHVLTQNYTVISSDYYAEYAIKHLPRMHIASPVTHTVSHEMMSAIQQSVKEKIFERFIVSLKNEYEWYLQDKNDPLFTVCCNASCLPIGVLYAKYEQVKQEAKKKSGIQNAWTADIRFNHQIVLSRYKGGRNGKGIQ